MTQGLKPQTADRKLAVKKLIGSADGSKLNPTLRINPANLLV
jgi:hypothetical protein